jgi:peptide/nickel transport system substrate-binding protein
MLPQHVHEALKEKGEFGHHPVRTGPYRYIQVDPNKGLVAVKRDSYPQAGAGKTAPTIGRFTVTMVGDPGTTVAMLMADKIDIARDIPADQAENLATRPEFALTLRDSQGAQYLLIDAKGRSGVKALTDVNVREAIMKAIDVKPYQTLVFGKSYEDVTRPGAICSPRQIGCDYSVPQVQYDPKGAKDILARSNYPDGFDVVITPLRGRARKLRK